jgi:pterin-4a-carbinolamine dehydratase
VTAPRSPGWHRHCEALVRDIVVRDFDAAWDVVRHIADGVEDYGRRPDMSFRGSTASG